MHKIKRVGIVVVIAGALMAPGTASAAPDCKVTKTCPISSVTKASGEAKIGTAGTSGRCIRLTPWTGCLRLF